MRKILNIFLIMLIIVGVIIPPSTVSAYNFSTTPKPKETSYKRAPVYYLDIKSPDNKNGLVPAGYQHITKTRDKWERLANREFALKEEVWSYVWEWRNQPRDTSKTILTPMEELTWTGNLQGSITASATKIEAANSKYKIKEIMVYPVHKERTYAISLADAILKQSRDNYNKDISEVANIDAQWSGIPNRNKPYVWTGGAPSPYPWKTYFPSPKVYSHADYPGGTRFGNYDLVYKVDSTGRSRWLNTPDFWRDWVKDTNDGAKVSFAQEVQSEQYFGRAHPLYYTPGNHPYMRTMKYDDWTFDRLTDSFPNATCPGDESCGFPYANWQAMVHMQESDYKIEAILEKKEEEKPPTPGAACTLEILQPTAGTKQIADKMEANPSGEIKADDRDNHKFNVLDGIPTSEALYANALTKEYVHKNTFTEMSGRTKYVVPVTKTYHLEWVTSSTDSDGHTTYTYHSDTVKVEKTYDVYRPYLYWLIDNLEVYGLEKADMSNYALPNGKITMYPKGYTPPNVNAKNDDDVKKHVFPAPCKSVDKGSQTINGGSSRPPVPNEDFRPDAENATGKTEVENDLVEFNGSKIMDNKRVVEKGPTPTQIPEAKMTNRDVFYEKGMVISKTLVNKKDTPSSGNIYYNLLVGIKGGSPKVYPINGINTVTVHTPVVIYADVSDDKEHNQRTKPDQSKRGVILDRPFTIYMPTNGQHRNILGYGDRDYAKYVRTKQVRFPFDVWHYKNGVKGQFVPANTWIDIPVAEVQSTFYLPVWIDERNYEVLFRTIAENAPPNFTTQPNANLDLTHHVATDVIPVNIIGRVYDFRVTDIADYNWEEVFRINKGSYKHTGNYYWVQDRGIDGELRGNKFPYVLPIMPGSHPNYKNVSVKTGYHFKFDLKTKGNMFGPGDAIRITPTFYFVTKDGKNRQEVDLYYKKDAKNFVQIGSPEDKEKRYVIMNNRLRNVPQGDLVNAADFAYDHYPNRTTNIKNRFIEEYLEKAKEKTWVGDWSWMILNYRLKTHIGPSTIPAGAMVDQQRAIASIHQWYGEYSIPANVYTVAKGTNLAEHGRMNPINDKSPIFLKNGYIIVNFNIETIRNEDLNNPYLQYIYAPLANQWQIEGYKNSRIDPYGNNFSLKDGDVVFYHGDLSSYDDFQSNVTH